MYYILRRIPYFGEYFIYVNCLKILFTFLISANKFALFICYSKIFYLRIKFPFLIKNPPQQCIFSFFLTLSLVKFNFQFQEYYEKIKTRLMRYISHSHTSRVSDFNLVSFLFFIYIELFNCKSHESFKKQNKISLSKY